MPGTAYSRLFLDTPLPYGKISALAEIAQLVEHATENCGVDSSILSLGTLTSKAPPPGGFLFPKFFTHTTGWGKIHPNISIT